MAFDHAASSRRCRCREIVACTVSAVVEAATIGQEFELLVLRIESAHRALKLREAAHGLYYAPVESRFGPAPAREEEILRAFFGKSPFVITGPPRWNALGLGSTAMFAATLVYNTRRTGEFTLDGRRFLFRRVLFPDNPPPEWFVVDLLQHHEMAGVSLAEIEARLVATLREGRWSRNRLREMANTYATKATLGFVERCLAAEGAVSF